MTEFLPQLYLGVVTGDDQGFESLVFWLIWGGLLGWEGFLFLLYFF